jgi:hypothetical protein
MSDATLLMNQLLDLLVDGPSSFAALYSAANRFYPPDSSRRFAVSELWEALGSAEKRGLVKAKVMRAEGNFTNVDEMRREQVRKRYEAWLLTAGFDEMSVDEVGLWFEILPQGRTEWRKWSGEANAAQNWMLEQDAEKSTIVVYAKNAETAEKTLNDWLAQNPDMRIDPRSRDVVSVDHFQLRDGTLVEGGVRVLVAYSTPDG